MRSFEERIAEINRRSGRMIKERKKRRKYILTACIPVVLCIGLWLAWPAQKPTPEEPKDTNNAINVPLDSPSPQRYVLRVDVSGNDFSSYHTDEDLVTEIYDRLCSFTVSEDVEYQEPPTEAIIDGGHTNGGSNDIVCGEQPQPEYSVDSSPIQDQSPDQYHITLTLANGKKIEYVLIDHVLYNITTNEDVSLSDNEVEKLKTLLGIPEP